jgi:hypothetical protein
MSFRIPLVIVDGLVQQLQPGDTLVTTTAINNTRSAANGEPLAPLVIGSPVYVAAVDTCRQAKGDAYFSSKVIGLWYEFSTPIAQFGSFASSGILVATTTQWNAISGSTNGLITGARYYLDTANAGRITSTVPSTSGLFIVPLGIALSTTEFEIAIQPSIQL